MKIIMFDGVCNLCNSTINFIIDKDKNNEFKFTSLQSNYADVFFKDNKLEKDLSTIILVENDKIYDKSTAILKIFQSLKGYRWMKLFFLFPKFIRDAVYKIISKNRYFIYGKNESCRIPTTGLMKKFIE